MNTLRSIILFLITVSLFYACTNEKTEVNHYENGIISSEIHYKNNQLDGESRYYFDNGNLQSVFIYKEGLLNGRSTTWFLNENMESESYYKLGMLEGSKKEFNENASPAYSETYHHDTLNGEYISYHPNGKIRIKGYYKMGLFDSTWIYLDRFGVMVGRANFHQGSGQQIAYYSNGNKKQVVPYKNNKIDGTKEFFSPDGKLIKIQIYENGEFINETIK